MRVVALVDDLMDRSKVATAADVVFVRDAEACSDADVVVVDLARFANQVVAVRAVAPGARIVAFGPHVDEDLLAQAHRSGADTVLARSAFFRDPAAAISGTGGARLPRGNPPVAG